MTEYRYDPAKLRLTLNGWQLDNRGERETHIRETYRVEFPDHAPDLNPALAEMHLYDLEDVQSGEEESLRLTLRKTTCYYI